MIKNPWQLNPWSLGSYSTYQPGYQTPFSASSASPRVTAISPASIPNPRTAF